MAHATGQRPLHLGPQGASHSLQVLAPSPHTQDAKKGHLRTWSSRWDQCCGLLQGPPETHTSEMRGCWGSLEDPWARTDSVGSAFCSVLGVSLPLSLTVTHPPLEVAQGIVTKMLVFSAKNGSSSPLVTVVLPHRLRPLAHQSVPHTIYEESQASSPQQLCRSPWPRSGHPTCSSFHSHLSSCTKGQLHTHAGMPCKHPFPWCFVSLHSCVS